jgi:hypothetical protein
MTPEQMRAAIDARQDLDILRDINSTPAESQQMKNEDIARAAQERVQPKLDDAKKTRRTCSPAIRSWRRRCCCCACSWQGRRSKS